MKNFLYLTLTLVQATISFAQDSQGVSLSHYVFPEFTEGVVKNKSGAIDKARLNYNAITQEFIFEKGTQKLALAQISTIDTVFVQGRKFIPVDSVFYEVVNTRTQVQLFEQHKCKIEFPGKNLGFGASSQTTAATSLSSYNSSNASRMVYNLKLPDGYKVTPYQEFWLKKGKGFVKISNLKQLLKVFPEKQVIIKEYAAKNKLRFNNEIDLVQMLNFMGN